MRPFNWAGVEVLVTREPTTADWWQWVAVVLPSNRLLSVIDFVAPFISLSPETMIELAAEEPLGALGDRLFSASVAPLLSECLQMVYGADQLNRSKVRRACQCLACSGIAPHDNDCRFVAAGIALTTRLVAAQEPDLIAAMWDRPYSLYALAVEQRRAERDRDLVAVYPLEDERQRRSSEAAFDRLRRYHVHA
jgi:hypothetical protein